MADRQGERRQVGRAERRAERRPLPVRLRRRRRRDPRGGRAAARGQADHRRPRAGRRRRRHRADRERLHGRPRPGARRRGCRRAASRRSRSSSTSARSSSAASAGAGSSSLLIISGAFGLFRRDEVEAVGGYRTDTVGEDAELVVRLHRHLRERGDDYRIEFVPDPVCWTEAPESTARPVAPAPPLAARPGRDALAPPRDVRPARATAPLGMVALPVLLRVRAVRPAVRADLVRPDAAARTRSGLLDIGDPGRVPRRGRPARRAAVGGRARARGVLLPPPRAAGATSARMLAYAVLENFGYRQLVDFWRLQGLWDIVRGKQGWGDMKRKGFAVVTPGAARQLDGKTGQRTEPARRSAASVCRARVVEPGSGPRAVASAPADRERPAVASERTPPSAAPGGSRRRYRADRVTTEPTTTATNGYTRRSPSATAADTRRGSETLDTTAKRAADRTRRCLLLRTRT